MTFLKLFHQLSWTLFGKPVNIVGVALKNISHGNFGSTNGVRLEPDHLFGHYFIVSCGAANVSAVIQLIYHF